MHKTLATTSYQLSFRWVSMSADIVLAALVSGPLAAPFLASSTLPLLPVIANIIYGMGMYVCPQPDMGLVLAPPFAMAVCMRCYGTVLGLLATRLLYTSDQGRGFYWLRQYGWRGIVLTGVLIMAYPAELAAQSFGVWGFNHLVMTLFGLVTGTALGLLIIPMLHTQPTRSD